MKKPRPAKPARAAVIALCVAALVVSLAATGLLAFRTWTSDSFEYDFMLWNLALAWAPLGLALLTLFARARGWPFGTKAALALLWLLFLPNAPYLVTDLVHLRDSWAAAPLWFDALMFSVFGLAGLLLGYASLYVMEGMVEERFGETGERMWLGAVFLLSSMGIYLGRALRLNSWDAVTHPRMVTGIFVGRARDPFGNPELIVVVVVMTTLLAAGYALFLASGRAARERVEGGGRG
jgi:uncharacterized membrane protein